MAPRTRPDSAPRPPVRSELHEIERSHLVAWLDVTADVPVRVLCAPLGAGKTLGVRQYVRGRAGRAAYVRIPAGTGPGALRRLIEAIEADEVVLDELDRADGSSCDDLREAVLDGGMSKRLIAVGRSRRRLRIGGLLARGLALVYDAAGFAFSGDELGELAARAGAKADAGVLARLREQTEGWALAAHWIVRYATEAGLPLGEAFEPWRERNGHLLFELLEHERYEDADAFETFRRMLAEGWADAQHELERLEQLGLPVVREAGGLRPYRLLVQLATPSGQPVAALSEAPAPLMYLVVLGRFRCEIAGRPVAFARRRDLQVFAYVAVAPEGRTSRERVLEAFWPGIDRAAAAQSLRVTLSRIRRAIAEAAGTVEPERYFHTVGDLAIDPRVVAVDVRRFVDHIEQGRLDDAAGNIDGAKYHYGHAHRLYADRLLASEGHEPCLEPRVTDFESFYEEALTRLMSLHAATGELETAREYARELLSRNSIQGRERALGLIGGVPRATA